MGRFAKKPWKKSPEKAPEKIPEISIDASLELKDKFDRAERLFQERRAASAHFRKIEQSVPRKISDSAAVRQLPRPPGQRALPPPSAGFSPPRFPYYRTYLDEVFPRTPVALATRKNLPDLDPHPLSELLQILHAIAEALEPLSPTLHLVGRPDVEIDCVQKRVSGQVHCRLLLEAGKRPAELKRLDSDFNSRMELLLGAVRKIFWNIEWHLLKKEDGAENRIFVLVISLRKTFHAFPLIERAHGPE